MKNNVTEAGSTCLMLGGVLIGNILGYISMGLGIVLTLIQLIKILVNFIKNHKGDKNG